jgi:hypothetical protein
LAQPHPFQGTPLQPLRIIWRIELAQQVLADHGLYDVIRENVFNFHLASVGSVFADTARPAFEQTQDGLVACRLHECPEIESANGGAGPPFFIS